ncbi:SPOR domain-containing protein [Leeia oryzae]|uniref:SPOR domain-containing protein n=1 Tax=Leeia oryzae TaxID=356662 RepID=UPI0003746E3F|nr:SPOR domain-containing protein [Leeia oryzae]
MQENQPTPNDDIKQQAVRRVLIAIALIMAAIVVLNAISRLKESQQKELVASTATVAEAVPTAPVAPPAKKEAPASIEQPASAVSSEIPASAPLEASASSLRPAPPVVINDNGVHPVAPQKPAPVPLRQDNLPGTPLAVAPATATPVIIKPQPAVKPAGPLAQPTAAPASPPATKPTATAPATPQTVPATKAPALQGSVIQSYTVQAGVFGQYDNAAMLYQKLRDQGIPAKLESRVIIGPFKDKAAAAAAVRELQALGIKPVVIPNVANGH